MCKIYQDWWLRSTRFWITRAYSEDYNAYQGLPSGTQGDFGSLLCWEMHTNEMTFRWLAKKWDISLPVLGELIADHCRRLDE